VTPSFATRPRFGEGELALLPAKSVFINCPFDREYAPLFDAIVFATVCCGFMPRSALESGDVAESRLDRITRAIFNSRYSIHDLSRCSGEGDENLARFNMPLELGMAMAKRFIGGAGDHDWLVLVPEGHAYGKLISDLAAFDPPRHDGSVEKVTSAVMAWLATRKDAVPAVTPKLVLSKLSEFREKKAGLDDTWGGYTPWADVIVLANETAKTVQTWAPE